MFIVIMLSYVFMIMVYPVIRLPLSIMISHVYVPDRIYYTGNETVIVEPLGTILVFHAVLLTF